MNDIIHVFVGPSLTAQKRPPVMDLVYHAPASQGDVYALVEQRPFAIAVVDGYFEHTAAVWHKELLWAMSEGVHVFGAASMGALRAAELADFGAVGVGEVFAAFRSGELRDDDEVTIVHANEDDGYRPLSDAMVNIRHTLRRAGQEGAFLESTIQALVEHAKQQFYPERSFAELCQWSRRAFSSSEADRVCGWLSERRNHVDTKQRDALQLLDTLATFRRNRPGPKQVPWTFHHTDAWETVRRQALARMSDDGGSAWQSINEFA